MTGTDSGSVKGPWLMRRIGRRRRRTALIVIGLVVIGGGGLGSYYATRERPESQVEVRVAHVKPNPCTDVYSPLFVALLNRSARTVTQVRYRLIARHPGQSANLVEGDEIRQVGDITKPRTGVGYCQKVPLLTERFLSWQSLEWTAEIVSVSFE